MTELTHRTPMDLFFLLMYPQETTARVPRSRQGGSRGPLERSRREHTDLIVVAVGVLVLCAVQVWVSVIFRQIQREANASLAEMRLGAARIAALAAEVLGRPRP